MRYKVGQRVEILMSISGLKHRKKPVFGFITNIDGSYILVRPTWCSWVVELYPNEIKV